jgi:carbon-monoxide dehydrogenase large subunit
MPRLEDRALLTGAARYTGDIPVDGALVLAFVRSPIAHARVAGIDVSAAAGAPGVAGVFTAADLPELAPYCAVPGMPEAVNRPVLARDVVRFVGEPVAVVAASSEAAAVDAAELVEVDYDPLPVVVDPDEARSPGAPAVLDGLEANRAVQFPGPQRDDSVFEKADVVVDAVFENQRVAVMPMETNVILAEPTSDGGLVVHVSTQAPHNVRDGFAASLGLDASRIRVVAPSVGGGFGAKSMPDHECLLACALALRLGRPVRWRQTRSENLQSQHGRAQRQRVRVAASRDGELLGIDAHIVSDGGAYPSVNAFLPMLTQRMMAGVYRLPAVSSAAEAIATNTAPPTAYRGAGRPEAACMVERAVDMVAAELGLDPVDVRRRNLLPIDAFPYTTPTGAVYDSGDYQRALDEALTLAGYDGLRAEQRARIERGDNRLLGIGVCVYVEVTAGAAPTEFADVEVHADGTATVKCGTSSHGQGHRTTMAQIASDVLHIPVESIDVIDGDTARVARGQGTYSSRSVQVGGTAVHEAANVVVEQARKLAADLLEANVDDIRLDAAGFSVAGVPSRSVGWHDVVAAAERDRPEAEPTWRALAASLDWERSAPTFPFGAHVAVVEVDRETGFVQLVRHVAVDDCGEVINPLLADGQVHGGVAQGAAQALYEAVRYDEDGNLLTGTLLDYAMPSAAELPSFELARTVTPTPVNPLGAKGIGESGTIGSTPAVHNAVVDALAPFGVRHLDMPCTPERVWRAMQEAAAS